MAISYILDIISIYFVEGEKTVISRQKNYLMSKMIIIFLILSLFFQITSYENEAPIDRFTQEYNREYFLINNRLEVPIIMNESKQIQEIYQLFQIASHVILFINITLKAMTDHKPPFDPIRNSRILSRLNLTLRALINPHQHMSRFKAPFHCL